MVFFAHTESLLVVRTIANCSDEVMDSTTTNKSMGRPNPLN